MSGATRVRSMNTSDSEARPVFGSGSNKPRKLTNARRPVLRPLKSVEESAEDAVSPVGSKSPSVLSKNESFLGSNSSQSGSTSSDASTDSFRSRASTGRTCRANSRYNGKEELAVLKPRNGGGGGANVVQASSFEPGQAKSRCHWITATTDASYNAFHDEEWGVPTHDDKKLFEYLVLSMALAELTWSDILNNRHLFREVFGDFDPTAVAKLNEKEILAPGSRARSLLSELKLRSIVENAHQVSKVEHYAGILRFDVITQTSLEISGITKTSPEVIEEFGSFSKYIWSFVNNKPIVGNFRYPRQMPVKTPKAEAISKDLMKRGFRSVGPTVVYSFMQVSGITNDHLMSCFRFQDCKAQI